MNGTPQIQQGAIEPWLRGPLQGVDASVMPVFFSFQQVREDLAQHISSLSTEELWRPVGNTSVGFHLQHIAGSVDRLSTYLAGGSLSEAQMEELGREKQGAMDAIELLHLIHDALSKAEQVLHSIDRNSFYQTRFVGRQRLPTTVMGLLVHLAEHTQRHLGQVIILAQVVRLP
jgi:uncharacterized damage-inducible protein DinB